MRQQFTDWHTAFKVYSRADSQAVYSLTKALVAKAVTAINVDDVTAIGIQWSGGELITEQFEVALRKVEQRADARIRLAVVVTEVTFEVTA